MTASSMSQAVCSPTVALHGLDRGGALCLVLRWVIMGTTVLMLAWSASQTVGARGAFQEAGESRLTFQPDNQGGARSRVMLESLLVDGQLLRWPALQALNGWEPNTERGSGLPPALVGRGGESLTFSGTRWLLFLRAREWTGAVRVEQQQGAVSVVEIRAVDGADRLFIVEHPLAAPSALSFAGGIIVFATLAWWVWPIHGGRRPEIWLLLCLSTVHLLFWSSQAVGTNNDSPGYLDSIREIFLKGEPSYFPPGYPALLAVIRAFSAQELGRCITLAQHAMTVVVGLWIYRLLLRVMPTEFALIGGLLAGALSPTLAASQAVMSEMPTCFAMTGALYCAVRSMETGQWRFAVMAGLLAGWGGTLRVVPLLALFPSICLISVGATRPFRYRLLGSALVIAAITVLLPLSWFAYKSGQLTLASSQGFHLFNRVVTEQRQLDVTAPATRSLLALLEGWDPRGETWWDVRSHGPLQGWSDDDVEALFRRVALEGIRKDPWAFVAYTPRLAWRMLIAPTDWIAAWGDTIARHVELESPPPLPLTRASFMWRQMMEGLHWTLWPPLCWLAVAGLLVGMLLPQRILILAMAWIPAGYLLASAGVEYFSPRYNAAAAPIVAALAVLPLWSLLRLVWAPATGGQGVSG